MNPSFTSSAWMGSAALFIVATMAVNSSSAQLIVAHRGASHDAPENTIAAFKLAWKQRADAVEGDFYLTSDDQIVAIHDRTTKRTAGQELDVAQTPFEQLRQLDVGSWKSPKYQGERIPTLAEVLAAVPKGKKIFIEIKCGPEIVPQMNKVIQQSKLTPEQTVVIAFNEDVIAAVKQQIPEIKAYWLTGFKQEKETGEWKPSLKKVLRTLEAIKADGLDLQAKREVVNADFVKALRDRGMEFHAWTIDDPQDAAYFQQLGVDSITTNRPGELRGKLR
jgi:glycerophosphoryl diester phosphodiesterase